MIQVGGIDSQLFPFAGLGLAEVREGILDVVVVVVVFIFVIIVIGRNVTAIVVISALDI